MRIEEAAAERLEVVRLSELGDSASFPSLPSFLWRPGKRLGVAFENGDGMALASQHHCRREPDNPAA
jgi:hypothetical protein